MSNYQIRIELDERFGPEDVVLDLEANQSHPFHQHEAEISAEPWGGATVGLAVAAPDLWTAILLTMALMHQSGYVPAAVQAKPSGG